MKADENKANSLKSTELKQVHSELLALRQRVIALIINDDDENPGNSIDVTTAHFKSPFFLN